MDKELVVNKLAYLKELLEKLSVRFEKYDNESDLENKETLYLAINKLSEEIVEIAIKINNIFLEENKDYSPTYYETFLRLKKHYKKIDVKVLEKLAQTTSIRNKITHEYEMMKENEDETIRRLKKILVLYKQYIKIIKNIL